MAETWFTFYNVWNIHLAHCSVIQSYSQLLLSQLRLQQAIPSHLAANLFPIQLWYHITISCNHRYMIFLQCEKNPLSTLYCAPVTLTVVFLPVGNYTYSNRDIFQCPNNTVLWRFTYPICAPFCAQVTLTVVFQPVCNYAYSKHFLHIPLPSHYLPIYFQLIFDII